MTNNLKHLRTKNIDEWLESHSALCVVPDQQLTYSPKRLCSFALLMVQSLVSSGPLFYELFETFISSKEQKKIATDCFEYLKTTPLNKQGSKGLKGYFQTNRTFSTL